MRPPSHHPRPLEMRNKAHRLRIKVILNRAVEKILIRFDLRKFEP